MTPVNTSLLPLTTPATAGTPSAQDSINPEIVTLTTATEADETTISLFMTEIKYAETNSLLRLYQDIIVIRVGTGDLESQAMAMARQEINKRGTILSKGTLGGLRSRSHPPDLAEARSKTGTVRVECQQYQVQLGVVGDGGEDSGGKERPQWDWPWRMCWRWGGECDQGVRTLAKGLQMWTIDHGQDCQDQTGPGEEHDQGCQEQHRPAQEKTEDTSLQEHLQQDHQEGWRSQKKGLGEVSKKHKNEMFYLKKKHMKCCRLHQDQSQWAATKSGAQGDSCDPPWDAVALYPSLWHKELIRDCPAKFSGLDIQSAAVFVTTYSTVSEITQSGLGGRQPTPSTRELTCRAANSQENQEHCKFHQVRQDSPRRRWRGW